MFEKPSNTRSQADLKAAFCLPSFTTPLINQKPPPCLAPMHCCLIGHRQINVVQNCPAANLTLSAQVCSCPHGGPWKAIVTMEQSNRLASCLRSHSLISLARLSAKQRSASGPWLNAGSTPCIYQTTRYALHSNWCDVPRHLQR